MPDLLNCNLHIYFRNSLSRLKNTVLPLRKNFSNFPKIEIKLSTKF